MPTGHVFIATSLDGFIARADGSLDWLISPAHEGEDHGYDAFMANIDAIVMGRGTYEAVLGFDAWPYDKPVLVLSRQLAGSEPPEGLQGKVTFADLSPQAAMDHLGQQGAARVYVDGGQIVQAFLRAGLVADMVLSRIPVLIGAGRSLFGAVDRDLALVHQATTAFPSGLVQSRYSVVG
ncbi:dihydrofolate reductase family protein [Rhodobacter sp. SY28-1]|uniref:dihydrofolate reductase family protein n=1 Tax=Rhodobacter sp. SY28-1 TaxID=2562317 RepID=UPI0010C1425D|nr:dihydrofolate reductase family protein [Rhodobacter sp. SY28-1]